jgi:FkbM family methyltransferase
MNLRKSLKYFAHSYAPGLRGWFNYFGTRVYFPQGAWIFQLACEEGIYESQILKLIHGLLRPGSWYFDVGGNIGLMSVPILAQRPDVNVLTLEPSPNSQEFIQRTRRESPWQDRWKVLSKAAGNAKGVAEFSFGHSELGGYDGLYHTNRVEKRGVRSVEVTTLDHEWEEMAEPPVSFIKLDIEGAESLAIDGASRMVRQCRPYMIVEWYAANLVPYELKPEALLELAARIEYDVVSVPTMTPVTTEPLLRALMVQTSAFMLIPKR